MRNEPAFRARRLLSLPVPGHARRIHQSLTSATLLPVRADR